MIAKFTLARRTAEIVDRLLARTPRAHEEESADRRQEHHDPENDPNDDINHTRHRLPLRTPGSKRRVRKTLTLMQKRDRLATNRIFAVAPYACSATIILYQLMAITSTVGGSSHALLFL
jgi:hypothetical protein